MAIILYCTTCKSGTKLVTKKCKKCNSKFTASNRKYRVMVKQPNGKQKTKIAPSLELAKKIEAKFKTESVENQIFDIHKVPTISEIWTQYLT